MKNKKSLLSLILALCLCMALAAPAWASDADKNSYEELNAKYNDEFFNQLRLDMVEEELQSYGIIAKEVDLQEILPATLADDSEISSETIFDYAEMLAEENTENIKERDELVNKINDLKTIPVTYVDFESKKAYSSENGYVGDVKEISSVPYITGDILNETDNEANISTMSQTNPTPSEINGGDTGAFSRRQLGFGGFDKITSIVTLPHISNVTTGEQPWVYYGFDCAGKAGAEGGFSYQTGRRIWIPYIRCGELYYEQSNGGNVSYKDGTVINDVNFVIKKQSSSDTYYHAYLLCLTDELIVYKTNFTNSDINGMSVKMMTSIGSNFKFNGSNISTKSENQKFIKTNVRKYYENTYKSWDSYNEYSSWQNGKWYGTINCTSSYIHSNNGSISIYK